MPNRLIKESICASESIDNLSPFQETFFYRLIVNCDDFGRMDARLDILASKLYPLRRTMPTGKIKDALQALVKERMVDTYEVNGKPYLQLINWNKYQQIRAKKSKYPAPDTNGKQMISDDIKCPRNPIQSESNTESESNTNTIQARAREDERNDGFTRFWDAYPRKNGGDIQQAFMEYLHVTRDLGVDPETLIAAVEEQKKKITPESMRYVPGAEKWLKNRGWMEKQPEPEKKTNNPFIRQMLKEKESETNT